MENIEQDVPGFSTRMLREHGLLSCPAEEEVELENGGVLQVTHKTPDTLWVSGSGLGNPQTIALAWGTTPFGRSPFLICPVTGTRRRTLYLVEGQLVSRSAGRLTYRSQHTDTVSRLQERKHKVMARVSGDDGKRAPLGEAKNRRLRELAKIRWELRNRGVEADDILRFLWAHPPRRPDAPKPRVRPPRHLPRMSTRRALLEGRKGDPKPSREIVRFLDETFKRGCKPPRFNAAHTPARLEHFPELDIRPLRPRKGLARALKLRWAPDRNGDAVELRGMITKDQRRLVLIGFDDAVPKFVKQEIQLVKGRRRGDLFMICPINGTRHVKLYFRDGYFASRKAQRLITSSEASQWTRQDSLLLNADPARVRAIAREILISRGH